jgi:hypothetical protein
MPEVGQPSATFILHPVRSFISLLHFNLKYGFTFACVLPYCVINVGTAIKMRSSINHIYLFIGFYAGYASVIPHPDKQPSAVGVSKSCQCPGNLSAVRNAELKVKLLIFTLCDQLFQIAFHLDNIKFRLCDAR